METEKIELRQERDFGQVFNAAFAFLKQELKPFCIALLTFVLPVMLLMGIGFAVIYSSMFGMIKAQPTRNSAEFLVKFFGSFGWIMLFALLAQSMLFLTVISYLKIYQRKHDSPSISELSGEIFSNLFPVIVAMILGGIVIIIGTIFCILPGVYLGVSLSLFIIALIIEKDGIGNAFSRSFQLTHMQWWWTFLIIFVGGILFYVLYMILEIPAYIMGINAVMLNIKQNTLSSSPFTNTYIIYQC